MKKINILMLLIATLFSFYSCEDEVGVKINPDAENGNITFHLNAPKYSGWIYELKLENAKLPMDVFTCEKPDFGYSSVVTYTTEISLSNDFTEGNFRVVGGAIDNEIISINTKDLNVAIASYYPDNVIPTPLAPIDVYVRLKARISPSATIKDVYSDVQKIVVIPYVLPKKVNYYELPAGTLKPYYIIGLGDGAWNNSKEGLGASVFPMNVVQGEKYEPDGTGEYIFTAYIEKDRGFKIIGTIGKWDEQWGNAGAPGMDKLVRKADVPDDPQNITVPVSGYYVINLNTSNNTLTIEAVETDPTVFEKIGIVGDINGWGNDIFMSAFGTSNNHLWYVKYEFTADAGDASDSGIKFRSNANWDGANWGGTYFPMALTSGDNIKYKTGTYMIFFSDIDKSYNFISLD